MLRSQIAVQLFSLKDHCKTAEDLAVTLRKVKAIGYAAVQISGVGPIPPKEIRRLCDGEGLVICATHEGGAKIINETQAVIDRLGELGTPYTAYPYPHELPTDLASTCRLAEQLDAAGAKMRAAGQVLTYHNHTHEFRKFAGVTMLEHLYNRTDPRNLQAEIDTYWVQAGGHDPVEWVARMHARLPLLHLKDYGITADNKGGLITEIGNGNLNWPAIISAGDRSGVRWFIVEQDVCPGDPFDSVAQSYRFLTDGLVKAG